MKRIIFWLLTAIAVTAVCFTVLSCDKEDPIPVPKHEVIKIPTTEVPANSFFQTNRVSNYVEDGIEYVVVLINDNKAMSVAISEVVTKSQNIAWDVGDILPYADAKDIIKRLNRGLNGNDTWKNLHPWLINEELYWKAENEKGSSIFINKNGTVIDEAYTSEDGTADIDFSNNQNLIIGHNLLDEPIELSLGENGTTGVIFNYVAIVNYNFNNYHFENVENYNSILFTYKVYYDEIRPDGETISGNKNINVEAKMTISGYEDKSFGYLDSIATYRTDYHEVVFFENNVAEFTSRDIYVFEDENKEPNLLKGITVTHNFDYPEKAKTEISGQEIEFVLPEVVAKSYFLFDFYIRAGGCHAISLTITLDGREIEDGMIIGI